MTDKLDGQYFNDMWYALEQELSQYDSYISDHDWMDSNTGGGNMHDTGFGGPTDESNLTPETYEELIQQMTHKDGPSREELRSKSRSERIQAVRELYNMMPTIVNASSVATLHKVASKLYKSGNVKQANKIMANTSKVFKSFIYQENSDNRDKTIQISAGTDTDAVVTIVDRTEKDTIVREKHFDNALDAVKFYLREE